MNKQTETVEKKKKVVKTMTGKVVSAKTPQTVIVGVTTTFRHPLYKKAVKKTRHFAAHNTKFEVVEGDTVTISEIKPVSKTKHFEVTAKV